MVAIDVFASEQIAQRGVDDDVLARKTGDAGVKTIIIRCGAPLALSSRGKRLGESETEDAVGHRTRYHLLCSDKTVACQQENEDENVAFHADKVST